MTKRKWTISLGLTILLAIAFGYNNCGMRTFFNSDGIMNGPGMSTTSGNPLTPPANYSAVTPTILSSICTLLQSCYSSQGATQSGCDSTLTTENSSDDTVLGLNEGTYSSYHDAIVGEQIGMITANTSATNTCISDISNQTCSTIVGSYDATLSNPYSPVGKSFPPSCVKVFGGSETDDDHESKDE